MVVLKIGTNPLGDDNDNASYLDGFEILSGVDQLNSADYPGVTTIEPTTSTSFTTTKTTTPDMIVAYIAGVVGVV